MGRYVLLVDDEQGILTALKRELRPWARERDLEIATASSAEEAQRFLTNHHLDVVIVLSDQRMPGTKGHELLALCEQRYPEIMRLMLTGYTDIKDIISAIRSGINSFILKPWDHEDLIYELTKAYNLFEMHQRNREYHRTVKNELALAAVLRGETARGGDYDHGWCFVGCRHAPSPEQTSRGVDLFQQVPIGRDFLLILAAHLDCDGVRGSMIGATMVLRVLHTVMDRQDCSGLDVAVLAAELSSVMGAVSREIPSVIIRYTVGILDRQGPIFRYAGNGYPPFVVVREDDYGEIEAVPEHPGRVRSVQIEEGDLLAVASPGLLESLSSQEDLNAPRVLAKHLRDASGESSLSRRAELILAAGSSGELTDRTLLLVQTGGPGEDPC
ncbi:hypothetical protein AU468_09575 [Alkalispirochaeta sphaeroplastigenens]|uniref:Response regulatory domain-containing protein n=1 Tax=Alkalispirochaeta sphaeroplastigenens TaxID=1187066 RepID=A0A2S4JM20_9SPIO|nr:response regulator [Alkalispirochaeta sphaeroplastigenens]POR00586.1 hypothetical protein AU468_09575 [Alkalispirochaeta sphaeroplastigenens]